MSSSIQSALEKEIQHVELLRLIVYSKKKKLHIIIIIIFSIIIMVGFFSLTIENSNSDPPFYLFIASLVIGVFVSFFCYEIIVSKSKKRFYAAYKELIIGGVAKYLQPEIKYKPSLGISKNVFNSLGHYKWPDRYSNEDLFYGNIGKTKIYFSEVKAEEKRTRNKSDFNSSHYWVTIFEGLIFMADFHKDFNTWLTISPDNESDGFFGRIAQKFQSMKPNVVRMENTEFEKHFLVCSPDDIQARYILTPDMQERLLELRTALSDEIRLSLHSSSIYVTIPKTENWFEADYRIPVGNESHLKRIASQMQFMFQIVDILNLNTRIWTKE